MLKNGISQNILKLTPNCRSHRFDSNDTSIASIQHHMLKLSHSEVFGKPIKSQVVGLTRLLTRQAIQ